MDRARTVRTGYIRASDCPEWSRSWLQELPREFELDDHRLADESISGFGWAEPEPSAIEKPAPKRHRTGTCFDVESTEMRAAAVPTISEFLGADAVVHEVRHQYNGYHTDLVFAEVDRSALRERALLTAGREPLHEPLQRFKTWWYIYEYGPKPRSDAEENGLYSDPSKNRRHLSWLLDHGWLARTSTDVLVALQPPRIAELHAVELKLRNWEEALEQAERANRCDGPDWRPAHWNDRFGYADYRWVAIDAGGVRPCLDNADRFRESGVGLLAVAEGGTVVKHIDAEHEPRERYTRDRAWVESEIWDQLDLDEWLETQEKDESSSGKSIQPGLATFTDGGRTFPVDVNGWTIKDAVEEIEEFGDDPERHYYYTTYSDVYHTSPDCPHIQDTDRLHFASMLSSLNGPWKAGAHRVVDALHGGDLDECSWCEKNDGGGR